MKTIYAVSMVKNENDIIESFCRYTLSVVDGLIIADDHSLDNTREIIEKLIDEGLNIILFENRLLFENKGYKEVQYKTKNDMIIMAMEEYGADIVLPLDADEFIFCKDWTNPRIELEKFDETTEPQICWRTYIFEKPLSDQNEFVPYHFKYYRNPKLERLYKTFISKKVFNEYDCMVGLGHHMIDFFGSEHPKKSYPGNLLIAHYPIRSCDQLFSKIIIGELNYKSELHRNFCGVHWEYMYEKIKQAGALNDAGMKEFSLKYDSGTMGEDYKEQDLTWELDPFKTNYLSGKITLKFTDYNLNTDECFIKILPHIESIIERFKKEIIQNKSDIETLQADISSIEEELVSNKSYLSEIENSRSWKLSRRLQKIYMVFLNLKHKNLLGKP